MGELAILVPVLGRPHRVEPLMESIEEATPDARVLFLVTPGDDEERAAIHAEGGELLDLDGNYAQKINEGVRYTTEQLIFLAADDLHFHPGWFERAVVLLSDEIGVVGTQDLCNKRVIAGEHSTHSLVARWYAELGTIDEPGKLLHEGYEHEWCDDEFVATAKSRHAFAVAPDAVVEHLHPMAGKAPMDDLYAGQQRRMRQGRRVFHQREHLWAHST